MIWFPGSGVNQLLSLRSYFLCLNVLITRERKSSTSAFRFMVEFRINLKKYLCRVLFIFSNLRRHFQFQTFLVFGGSHKNPSIYTKKAKSTNCNQFPKTNQLLFMPDYILVLTYPEHLRRLTIRQPPQKNAARTSAAFAGRISPIYTRLSVFSSRGRRSGTFAVLRVSSLNLLVLIFLSQICDSVLSETFFNCVPCRPILISRSVSAPPRRHRYRILMPPGGLSPRLRSCTLLSAACFSMCFMRFGQAALTAQSHTPHLDHVVSAFAACCLIRAYAGEGNGGRFSGFHSN